MITVFIRLSRGTGKWANASLIYLGIAETRDVLSRVIPVRSHHLHPKRTQRLG
jgi:hypothetical protein